MFNKIVHTSDELKKLSSILANSDSDSDSDYDSDSDSDSDSESINSSELDLMQKQLDEMLTDKINIDKLVKNKDNILSDLRCEDSFKKRQERKDKEREIEKKNIFGGDLNVYKRINEKHNKVIKKNKTINIEDYIPPFFEAKYYVIKYLDNKEMLEETDYEKPSDELYELYNILYNARYNEDYEVPDEFDEIVMDFIDSLPNKVILTESEIHLSMNDKSKHEILFTQLEEEENINEENINEENLDEDN